MLSIQYIDYTIPRNDFFNRIDSGLSFKDFTVNKGIRVGELEMLKWDDYDGSSIQIQRTETRFKDNTGKYVCRITEHVSDYLFDYPCVTKPVKSRVLEWNYQGLTPKNIKPY